MGRGDGKRQACTVHKNINSFKRVTCTRRGMALPKLRHLRWQPSTKAEHTEAPPNH